ncbi:MAG: alpha/beta hydrolase [Betaproteobacteria bacterium]|nr:alpha/beta hydrolase [Betaproteobacteria bacterium]
MEQVEIKKDIEFASHGGASLQGDLYRPKTPGKYPTMVAVHGGGWQLANRGVYQYWGPWLAERGYTTFACTYRLSKPGQKTFPDAIQDVRAAVQFVRGNASELGVDPDRIGLVGDSAGAHLAATVALAGEHPTFKDGNAGDKYGKVSTQVKLMVGSYGVYDLYQQWRHDLVSRVRDSIVEKFLGVSAIDDKRPYFEGSPMSYISGKNNGAAFLVVWGDTDDIVDHQTQSEMFLEALKQAGHFARPVAVTGAPHFWMADPINEPNSHAGFLAPRLLRFLQMKL